MDSFGLKKPYRHPGGHRGINIRKIGYLGLDVYENDFEGRQVVEMTVESTA